MSSQRVLKKFHQPSLSLPPLRFATKMYETKPDLHENFMHIRKANVRKPNWDWQGVKTDFWLANHAFRKVCELLLLEWEISFVGRRVIRPARKIVRLDRRWTLFSRQNPGIDASSYYAVASAWRCSPPSCKTDRYRFEVHNLFDWNMFLPVLDRTW